MNTELFGQTNSKRLQEVIKSHEDYCKANNLFPGDKAVDLIVRLMNAVEQLEEDNQSLLNRLVRIEKEFLK